MRKNRKKTKLIIIISIFALLAVVLSGLYFYVAIKNSYRVEITNNTDEPIQDIRLFYTAFDDPEGKLLKSELLQGESMTVNLSKYIETDGVLYIQGLENEKEEIIYDAGYVPSGESGLKKIEIN